jgi:hypothetical protein
MVGNFLRKIKSCYTKIEEFKCTCSYNLDIDIFIQRKEDLYKYFKNVSSFRY